MKHIDRNIQFLLKCKYLSLQNRLKQLIIPDRVIDYSTGIPYEQIMVSHYASAMNDQTITHSNVKKNNRYSVAAIFAIMNKLINEGNLGQAAQFLITALKEQLNGHKNKHLIIYNIVKLLSLEGNIVKATFYCENLLKQSGNGQDYYTYQFLTLLISQGRYEQAFKIASRHVQKPNDKHMIQSICILLLQKIYGDDPIGMLKKIDKVFNNKALCIRNYYNLALLLKHINYQKSLMMFKKLQAYTASKKQDRLHLCVKANIVQIYERYYFALYPHFIDKFKAKQIFEQCQKIYVELQNHVPAKENLNDRRRFVEQNLKTIKMEIRNETNINFFEAINFNNTKAQSKLYNKNAKRTENDEVMSQAESLSQLKGENESNMKYFNQRRAENEKRLKFLLRKEKQLKKFFDKLKIQKNGQKIKIKVLNSSQTARDNFLENVNQEQLGDIQSKFEERKKKFKMIYNEGEVDDIINDFVEEWMRPNKQNNNIGNKENPKVKNVESIKKFIVNLDCEDDGKEEQKEGKEVKGEKENQKRPQTNEKMSSSQTCRSNIQTASKRSTQNFRVKSNTSRRSSDKKMLEGLKNHDHISNQIIHNLKASLSQKKKEEKVQSKSGDKNFKNMLLQGEKLEEQKKYEQAYEHYAQMYKKFKENKEKEILLMKIAENFENLNLLSEAQKTYLKCTKFNNADAFFQLGNLQLRTGRIWQGIQNLQKANCIDRNNLKIQIKLVYAYSLLPQNTQRALALANSILKRNPQCIQALIMASKILQKKGKLKEALDIAIAIGNNCQSAPTFHYTGLLYLNDSNVSQAFHYFHKAIECQPDHLPSLIQIATILSQARPKEAIEILKNVLSQDPTNQLAFARLGKIYETFENDYENALLVYKKGLEHSPSCENYVKIGDCHLKLGSVMDAYMSYKQALNIKKTPQIYQKIAEVHQLQSQQKKAIEAYTSALAELPDDHTNFSKKKKYLFKLGKLSLQSQQYQVAHGYLCEVADMEQSFEVLKLLGQACFGKGDYKQALNYYEQAAGMQNQDNIELLQNIAMCFDKQEDYLTSKQIYERILSVDPKNIRCLNNLANIFLILGKTNEAFYWFEFMLQQVPTSIDKRLRVADIYATIGDWSKVQQHLMICYKQKENDIRVLERMVNLYKEKRDNKQMAKFEKRLILIKNSVKVNNL